MSVCVCLRMCVCICGCVCGRERVLSRDVVCCAVRSLLSCTQVTVLCTSAVFHGWTNTGSAHNVQGSGDRLHRGIARRKTFNVSFKTLRITVSFSRTGKPPAETRLLVTVQTPPRLRHAHVSKSSPALFYDYTVRFLSLLFSITLSLSFWPDMCSSLRPAGASDYDCL